MFFIALLIAGRPSTISVQAQSSYWIATEGVMWPDPRIQINIPSSPTILHDDLLQAMSVWNQALKWFESTYYPLDENYYRFIPSPNDAGVTVKAVDHIRCVSSPSNSTFTNATVTPFSCTLYTYNWDNRYIASAYVQIFSSQLTAANPKHLVDVISTLGILLGLVEYSTPCPVADDLMCEHGSSAYPSTLDLYALHLLSNGKPATNVTLPNDMPYQQASIPTPEFDGTAVLLLVLTGCSAIILARRKSRLVERFERN